MIAFENSLTIQPFFIRQLFFIAGLFVRNKQARQHAHSLHRTWPTLAFTHRNCFNTKSNTAKFDTKNDPSHAASDGSTI